MSFDALSKGPTSLKPHDILPLFHEQLEGTRLGIKFLSIVGPRNFIKYTLRSSFFGDNKSANPKPQIQEDNVDTNHSTSDVTWGLPADFSG